MPKLLILAHLRLYAHDGEVMASREADQTLELVDGHVGLRRVETFHLVDVREEEVGRQRGHYRQTIRRVQILRAPIQVEHEQVWERLVDDVVHFDGLLVALGLLLLVQVVLTRAPDAEDLLVRLDALEDVEEVAIGYLAE